MKIHRAKELSCSSRVLEGVTYFNKPPDPWSDMARLTTVEVRGQIVDHLAREYKRLDPDRGTMCFVFSDKYGEENQGGRGLANYMKKNKWGTVVSTGPYDNYNTGRRVATYLFVAGPEIVEEARELALKRTRRGRYGIG